MEETQRAAAQYEYQKASFRLSNHLRPNFMMVAMRSSLRRWRSASISRPSSRSRRRPITAAEQVRGGTSRRVCPKGKDDELVSLSRAFNRTTHRLRANASWGGNRQPDERRFTETVLTGARPG